MWRYSHESRRKIRIVLKAMEKLLNPKTYNSCRTFTSDKRVALYLTVYLYKNWTTLRRTVERR